MLSSMFRTKFRIKLNMFSILLNIPSKHVTYRLVYYFNVKNISHFQAHETCQNRNVSIVEYPNAVETHKISS